MKMLSHIRTSLSIKTKYNKVRSGGGERGGGRASDKFKRRTKLEETGAESIYGGAQRDGENINLAATRFKPPANRGREAKCKLAEENVIIIRFRGNVSPRATITYAAYTRVVVAA